MGGGLSWDSGLGFLLNWLFLFQEHNRMWKYCFRGPLASIYRGMILRRLSPRRRSRFHLSAFCLQSCEIEPSISLTAEGVQR